MMQIAFLDSVHKCLDQKLKASGYECVHLENEPWELIEKEINSFEGIVIRSRFPMDQEHLKNASNLRFIARSGAGMENIDEAYCHSRNIQLFNAPEGNRNAVGEHALGMLLSLMNKICLANQSVRLGQWLREEHRGIELEGKNIGIIGYGNNGSAFAKKLSGFDVNILAYDKYKKNYGDEYAQAVSLETIFEKADIVSFHVPLNATTNAWANEAFWAKFHQPIYLINLSRGAIIPTQDLVKALNEEKILGACLDVLEEEKTSFENLFESDKKSSSLQQLLKMENVLFSPHVGGWTQESYYKLSKVLADKIIAEFG